MKFPEGSDEAQRCREIGGILQEYSARDKEKPLSLAVFGPPGSGKSRCVREIAASVGEKYTFLPVINLSQLSEAEALGTAIVQRRESRAAKLQEMERTLLVKEEAGIKRGAKWPDKERKKLEKEKEELRQDNKRIPLFFFDEFDAPLAGAPLGWLRLFLAPMQDGQIAVKSEVHSIGQAVFMFAGGTASSFAEFEERASLDPAVREKKVPDFISRLRGFIDIRGINGRDGQPEAKRALVLRHLLDQGWPGARKKNGFPIKHKLASSLLSTGHFIHGVRSMEALLDMSKMDEGTLKLPDTQLRKLHLSRGELDGKLIGVSAGLNDGDESSARLLDELTQALLRDGAKVAYGGDFEPGGTLHLIADAAQGVPKHEGDVEKLICNYLGFPSFLRKTVKDSLKDYEHVIQVHFLETLTVRELTDLNLTKDEWFPARPRKGSDESYHPNQHLAWSISLFRMRVRLIQDIDALVVFGGKDDESWGRFPGIAEEVMLALAFEKPVYIMGGMGGAAKAVGLLLGLGDTIVNPDECLYDVTPITSLCPPKFKRAFSLPNLQLPETIEEVRDYFFARASKPDSRQLNSGHWNGLKHQENRKLFSADVQKSSAEAVQLILKGLSRIEWNPEAAAKLHNPLPV